MAQEADRSRYSPKALFVGCFLPALVFLAGMLGFFALYDPYIVVGEELISGGDFNVNPLAEPTQWEVRLRRVSWTGDEGFESTAGLRLETKEEKGGRLDLVLDNPRQYDALRVQARMRCEDIVVGSRPWRVARTLLFFTDKTQKAHWEVRTSVCMLTGTKGWKKYTETFPVPDFAEKAFLVVQNTARSGVAWADDLSLVPVRRKPTAGWWTGFFAVGWGLALFYSLFRLRLWKQRFGLLLTAVTLLTVVGVASPAPAVSAALDTPVEVVATVKELAQAPAPKPVVPPVAGTESKAPASKTPPAASDTAKTTQPAVRTPAVKTPPEKKLTAEQKVSRLLIARNLKKSGHVLLFAILAFFAMLTIRTNGALATRSIALTVAGLLLFAVATEALQILVDNREPAGRDVLIDGAGVVVGALLGWLVGRFFSARKRMQTSAS